MTLGDLYPHVLSVATRRVVEPVVGAPYLSIVRWLRDFEGWPDEQRQAWQERRLETVLRGAAANVPFYRGRRPRLQDLPVVDKAMIRADIDAFRADGWRRMRYVAKATAGTTGDPWQYELDIRAWANMYGAQLRAWERVGYRYGNRVVVLGTPPSLVPGGRSAKARLRAALERRTYAAAGIAIDLAASSERVRRAYDAGGKLWYGYAGMVAAMAEAVPEASITAPGPAAIVTTSEPLLPGWRRSIERAFGVPVVDEYGCNDGGVLAVSCPLGRFHVAENVSVIEILEGDEPCPPGVEGDIVVTNLHAQVLPFLRYRVGDRAVLGEGPCPCGLSGLTLSRLTGRIGDRIKLPDGRELQFSTFGPIFWKTPSVRRWQIVQNVRDRVKVRLDVDPSFSPAEEDEVRRGMTARVGECVAIDVVTTEPIERTGAGKQKVLISSVQ
jgi:phenylacetate-coenzyme A ligase PaaK-like adenylate-forming protein